MTRETTDKLMVSQITIMTRNYRYNKMILQILMNTYYTMRDFGEECLDFFYYLLDDKNHVTDL